MKRRETPIYRPGREASEKTKPTDTLILTSSLQNSEKINLRCLSQNKKSESTLVRGSD